ncbi:hypothetical protein D9757_000523 [Collybiopsis confluens]|uniref:P-loop containing nucleoside triphosphate hydrolase protein n=1 Tax=Collybiopsis confluens TaxID=2823264 RepID=A0A8H5I1D2_9AGAR|nr:hypothetical protein D9757_000523 [Collybiopsis confluens]
MTLPPAASHISNHILSQLSKYPCKNPLFVAVQGPQGSGKSFLTDLVCSHLTRSPHNLNVVVLSVDDLYLTHDGLASLAQQHPDNPLWRGRGQPGTHDIELGLDVLKQLREGMKGRELPRFEKSLFNGEGDRLPIDGTGMVVDPPVDVFIMEGWLMGFHPISAQELDARWNGIWAQERRLLNLDDRVVGAKDNIRAVNEALTQYVELWNFFDIFIKLEATSLPGSHSSLSTIYKWRLQQEHYMKARNGGRGMTDEAVKLFVDRYIPGYVFFADGILTGNGQSLPRWSGQSLRIRIDEKRDVIAVEGF